MLRQIALALAFAVGLLGCDAPVSDLRVPLITDVSEAGGGCWLLHQTVDVIADPATGTPSLRGGAPLRWPRGYSAWRAGPEVQVLDQAGRVVLTTGRRYELAPSPHTDYSKPLPEWVIGCVTPCPACALGSGLD